MKKADKQHLSRLAALGCIACRIQGTPGTPAEIHHPRAGTGMGLRAHHAEAIPLCAAHHRGTDHPRTPSIHLDKKKFVARFGTEAELLTITRHALAKMDRALEEEF
jgi:hypothetical protein